jgi:natural product precursor
MKKQLKKIVLAKETLRNLSGSEMKNVEGGGALPDSGVNTCRCHTASCKPGLC